MLPFVKVEKEFTTIVNGRVLKQVPCENCSTEYVYLLEREGFGQGHSYSRENDHAAANNAAYVAEFAVREYLDGDFDPVPCPNCGHYQKYMFRKLLEPTSHSSCFLTLLLLGLGGFSGANLVFWCVKYLEKANETAAERIGVAGLAFAVFATIGAWVYLRRRGRVRRFDPNTEDQQIRIARGKSRAVNLADIEEHRKQVSPELQTTTEVMTRVYVKLLDLSS